MCHCTYICKYIHSFWYWNHGRLTTLAQKSDLQNGVGVADMRPGSPVQTSCSINDAICPQIGWAWKQKRGLIAGSFFPDLQHEQGCKSTKKEWLVNSKWSVCSLCGWMSQIFAHFTVMSHEFRIYLDLCLSNLLCLVLHRFVIESDLDLFFP